MIHVVTPSFLGVLVCVPSRQQAPFTRSGLLILNQEFRKGLTANRMSAHMRESRPMASRIFRGL